jgi:hypothetical protein
VQLKKKKKTGQIKANCLSYIDKNSPQKHCTCLDFYPFNSANKVTAGNRSLHLFPWDLNQLLHHPHEAEISDGHPSTYQPHTTTLNLSALSETGSFKVGKLADVFTIL